MEGCGVVENKAVDVVLPIHEARLLTYLKLTGCRLGFLINWNVHLSSPRSRRGAIMACSMKTPEDTAQKLEVLCRRYGIDALYSFGSRAGEIARLVRENAPLPDFDSDVDIAVQLRKGRRLDVQERVDLGIELEDLLAVPRVDLVVLQLARPFLALDIVCGELLCCPDPVSQAEYELFVLRRAADLAFHERRRRAQIMEGLAR